MLNFDGHWCSRTSTFTVMCSKLIKSFCHIIGYSKAEIESGAVKWDDITPREFDPLDAKAIDEVLQTGKATPFEKEYIHRDGHRVPVLLAVTASDTTGSDCLSFALDLTLQKKAEETLRESESQFRQLCAMVPQIIWVADKNGDIVYLNGQIL